jgi:phosphoribosylaminoimidazole-succinocarboxamide synthase
MTEAEVRTLFPPGPPLAEGKSKTLYATARPDVCLMAFKPHARSITARREADVPGSDHWRLLATLEVLIHLEANGVPTHLRHHRALARGGRLFLIVCPARPVPVEWIVRYEAAGSVVRLFPTLVRPGQRFDPPLFKYDYKQDVQVAGVDDPTLSESYLVGLELLDEPTLAVAKERLGAVGRLVRDRLRAAGMRLIDMKIEQGFDPAGQLVVIDEVSQDCIRACEGNSDRALTKDLFRQRRSPEVVVAAYAEFARRLNPAIEERIWRID